MKKDNAGFTYAAWANILRPSIMQDMLERTTIPAKFSFALGLPDPELFPIEEYKNSMNNVSKLPSKSFQYSPPISSLKKHVVQLMALRQVQCNEEEIFITGGAQQAICLLSKLLLEDGGMLSTTTMTYPGFLQVVAPLRPNIIGVPLKPGDGLCFDTLKKVMANSHSKPAFFYIVSDGNNPLGTSLNEKQRKCIANFSRKYHVPVIEDDAYGFLNYEMPMKPIKSYENQWVFYIGSFSKILSPAFRIGWIVAPQEIIPKLSFIKEATDINTVSFGGRIIDDLLRRGVLPLHIKNLCDTYKEKRDVMLKALNTYFPKNTKIIVPTNGFFIWVELDEDINTTELLYHALEYEITFVPSEEFACNTASKTFNGMRLNFTNSNLITIEEGIKILALLIKNFKCRSKYSKQI